MTHAQVAAKLVEKILRTKMSAAERLAAYRWMHAKWPGLGWDAAIDATEKELAAQAK